MWYFPYDVNCIFILVTSGLDGPKMGRIPNTARAIIWGFYNLRLGRGPVVRRVINVGVSTAEVSV